LKENGTPVPRSRIKSPLMKIDANAVCLVRTQLQHIISLV
jgi:hypothetical protein